MLAREETVRPEVEDLFRDVFEYELSLIHI